MWRGQVSLGRRVRLSEIQLRRRQAVALHVVIGGVPSPRGRLAGAVRHSAVRLAVAVPDLVVLLQAVRQRPPPLQLVILLVELVEQEEEHGRVQADPPYERLRVVAVDEEQLERVDHHHHELDHLEDGQVLLPPEVRLQPRAHRCQQVVRVHHDVDERVQEAEERAVTACNLRYQGGC